LNLEAWRPYEAAMCAYHRGQHEVTIVVYDDYERDEAPVSYFFREPDDFPPLERLALDQCRGRILDVGAGSGCHSLELQRRGLSVTAIEILPGLLDILRQRGLRDARQATWMDLQIDQPYDTVLMMMNGLGLAETLTGLDRFFREARRLLQPDGQVLADSTDVRVRMDPEAARTGTLRRPDGRYLGELHFQLEFEGRKGPPFGQLYVDPETLQRRATAAGWGCEMLCEPDEYGHYLVRLTPVSRLGR
jgi:SAM-dependent methyltransferase